MGKRRTPIARTIIDIDAVDELWRRGVDLEVEELKSLVPDYRAKVEFLWDCFLGHCETREWLLFKDINISDSFDVIAIDSPEVSSELKKKYPALSPLMGQGKILIVITEKLPCRFIDALSTLLGELHPFYDCWEEI